ncbi:ABC transporter ATP-binding protein [Elusimicrobiota bacterium]
MEIVKQTVSNIVYIFKHFKSYKWKLILAVVLVCMYSVFEMIGISSVLSVLVKIMEKGAIDSTSTVIFDRIINTVFKFFSIPVTLFNLCALIAFFFIIKSMIEYVSKVYHARLANNYERKVKNRMFHYIVNSQWASFINYKRGYLIDYLVRQTVKSTLVLYNLVSEMANFIYMSVFLVGCFLVSVRLSLSAIVILSLILYVMLHVVKKVKHLSYRIVKIENRFTNLIQQYLSGLKIIKSFNIIKDVEETVKEQTHENFKYNMKLTKLQSLSHIFVQLTVVLIVLAYIYLSVTYAKIPPGESLVFAAFFLNIVRKANSLGGLNKITRNIPSLEVISKSQEDFKTFQESGTEKYVSLDNIGSIEVRNIGFAYEDDRPVLKDISFDVAKNTSLGITGPSGSGKTTLVDVLLGILHYSNGEILIGGKPLIDLTPGQWHAVLGYVPQESFLLNDTVHNNISFFRNISPDKVIEAAKSANAHDFIMDMKQGYDSMVGDSGVKLSGGQRQRLVIARAIVHKPQVLILDEATSELDSESENKIQQIFDDLKKQMTLISVAHRLSTIINCDNILVMENGSIVEGGSRDVLMEKDGLFKKMYLQQMQEPDQDTDGS